MSRAFNAVAMEELSIRRVALMYGLPKSTLGDQVSGHVLCGSTFGREKYLTDENEEDLATFIENCASMGYVELKSAEGMVGGIPSRNGTLFSPYRIRLQC